MITTGRRKRALPIPVAVNARDYDPASQPSVRATTMSPTPPPRRRCYPSPPTPRTTCALSQLLRETSLSSTLAGTCTTCRRCRARFLHHRRRRATTSRHPRRARLLHIILDAQNHSVLDAHQLYPSPPTTHATTRHRCYVPQLRHASTVAPAPPPLRRLRCRYVATAVTTLPPSQLRCRHHRRHVDAAETATLMPPRAQHCRHR